MMYRVTAPYVVLKVRDKVMGTYAFVGLYEGAVVDDVEEENLRHHLDLQMVEKIGGRPKADTEDKLSDDAPPSKSRRP